MNPYLEDPRLWTGFHQWFITSLASHMNAQFPPNYVANVETRVYIEKAETLRLITPDILLSQMTPSASASASRAALADPPYKVVLEPHEVRESFIQILHLRNGEHQVVTVVELLSPTNKLPNSEGRKQCLSKQAELLQSTTSLIEIDLLHQGEHTVAVPAEIVGRHSAWDYIISLHRGWAGGQAFEYWLVRLPERLPKIWVPLAQGDPDEVVDLQAVLDKVYQEGRYGMLIDYSQEPPVPLSDEMNRWVQEHLKAQGLRA